MSNQRSPPNPKSASSKRKKESQLYHSVMPEEDLNVLDVNVFYDSMVEKGPENSQLEQAPIDCLIEAVKQYGDEVNGLILKKLATMDANLGESEFLREMKDYILDCVREKRPADLSNSPPQLDELILASKRFSLQQGIGLRSLFSGQPREPAPRRGSNNSLASFFEESSSLLRDCSRLLKLHVKRICKQLKLFSKYDRKGLLEQVYGSIDRYQETIELFWDEQTEDRNYIRREKLLYDPVVAIPDLKPRHNIIYYYEEFREIHRPATFRWSRLFRPLRVFFEQQDGKEITGECRVELSKERFRDMMCAVGAAGLDFPTYSFSAAQVEKAFQGSLLGLGETKELPQRLPSGFTQQFLSKYISAFMIQNFDLNLHAQHLLAMDSLLKLQALTIMHICFLLFQGRQSYSYTRLRDFFLQMLIVEIRHLVELAKQVYRKLAERVDQYSQPPGRRTVSEKGSRLLAVLSKAVNNHMREDLADPICAADSWLSEEEPPAQRVVTSEDIVKGNFGRLLDIEQLLTRVLNI